jgi:predicted nucleic acid-binding protein
MLDAMADRVTLEMPALWPLEVANAVIVLVRRRKLSEDEPQAGLGWLCGLRVRIDHDMASGALLHLSVLAAAHHPSVYEAPYLELAQRRTLVLGCKDGLLRRLPGTVASASGIEAVETLPIHRSAHRHDSAARRG